MKHLIQLSHAKAFAEFIGNVMKFHAFHRFSQRQQCSECSAGQEPDASHIQNQHAASVLFDQFPNAIVVRVNASGIPHSTITKSNRRGLTRLQDAQIFGTARRLEQNPRVANGNRQVIVVENAGTHFVAPGARGHAVHVAKLASQLDRCKSASNCERGSIDEMMSEAVETLSTMWLRHQTVNKFYDEFPNWNSLFSLVKKCRSTLRTGVGRDTSIAVDGNCYSRREKNLGHDRALQRRCKLVSRSSRHRTNFPSRQDAELTENKSLIFRLFVESKSRLYAVDTGMRMNKHLLLKTFIALASGCGAAQENSEYHAVDKFVVTRLDATASTEDLTSE